MAVPNPERQRSARDKLAALFANSASVYVIHYACQNLDQDERHGSPRVTAVAARNLDTGDVASFSIHTEAELARLAPVQILSRMDCLERAMLDKLYDFFGARRSMHLVHWHMRDEVFGFPAIELRYAVLGGTPISLPETRRIDLARLLTDIYGNNYVAPPPIESLARLNGLPLRGLMAGREEADAFERGAYAAVKRSTLIKVRLMFDVLHLAHDGTLKTNSAAGGRPSPALDLSGSRVFISHANEDRELAARIVRLLEERGTRCWIAPRDVPLGADYQSAIVEAIETTDALVLLLSEAANVSTHVAREINLADQDAKPVFTLCADQARPKGSLRYQLNNRQWVDIGTDLPGAVAHLGRFLSPPLAHSSAPRASPP